MMPNASVPASEAAAQSYKAGQQEMAMVVVLEVASAEVEVVRTCL